ncbi:MAG: ABC transporter ATP-binding protein [Desulfopila sp.]|jgi:peptide/nickel transport system ATP-binding protein/oligopeptide transport system ATP-binding protein|nr:ABC transporter ATP-binding protein [Desulfopila sp.]
MKNRHLLEVSNLQTYFYTFEGVARAVNGVSYFLDKGETLGIVGESGCGKSVTASSVMRILPEPPAKIQGGSILFDGQDLAELSQKEMRKIRGSRIAMIFQEPMTSLNPVFTIGNQISEMFILHKGMNRREALEASADMLNRVQIPAPHQRVHEYPHQLSGGMRQRAMIAMALACEPEILIADEPTTALDVTVQAQILDIMLKLKEETGTAIQMITHDLGVIAETSNRIIVMYAGKVVEEADTVELFTQTLHPYTKGLLQSIPLLGSRSAGTQQTLNEIKGTVPSLFEIPAGCAFRQRCRHAMKVCAEQEPELKNVASSHAVRCWLHIPQEKK